MRLVLASASPRRRELLAAAGIAHEVDPLDVDESRLPDEPPHAYALRVARLKAATGALRHPGRLVLGADTVVVVNGSRVLGKPRDAADAAGMLAALSGRAHEVLTGVALASGPRVESAIDRTVVWVDPLSDEDIRRYVESGEPLDKAGAYAIQGQASRFIPRIEGSYSNVVGLPVATVVKMLKAWA